MAVTHRDDFIDVVLAALRASQGQLTEEEAAALVFRSKRRFRAIFRQYVGASYRTVRLRVKMECAQKALLETPTPISLISKQLGYTSRIKFDRSFERVFGHTPAQYRARYVSKGQRKMTAQGYRQV